MQKDATTNNAFRINKDILDKVKHIAKSNGQTISGYINIKLSKIVDKDWSKLPNSKIND
jgi:antitoxin component of RelBE/YafQ-DinJ toxin-antitoxin module